MVSEVNAPTQILIKVINDVRYNNYNKSIIKLSGAEKDQKEKEKMRWTNTHAYAKIHNALHCKLVAIGMFVLRRQASICWHKGKLWKGTYLCYFDMRTQSPSPGRLDY